MTTTLRSIDGLPVGTASGSSCACRPTPLAYTTSSVSNRSMPTTSVTAPALSCILRNLLRAGYLGDGGGTFWKWLTGVVDCALLRFCRVGIDVDFAIADGDTEQIHRSGCRPGDDFAVAIVDRAVAGAVKPSLRLKRVFGLFFGLPRYGAAKVGALLPKCDESLWHPRQEELARLKVLDIPNLQRVDGASIDLATER